MLSPVLCSHLPHSTATQLFQHLRIDVAAADDGDIQIGLRKLVAAEQEGAYRDGSAGLGYGYDIVHVEPDVLEIDGADALRAQPVGDGARNLTGRELNDLSGAQAGL